MKQTSLSSPSDACATASGVRPDCLPAVDDAAPAGHHITTRASEAINRQGRLRIAMFAALLGASSLASAATDSFTAVGANSWTVPAGVTQVTIEVAGAGGGGGGGTLYRNGGTGGRGALVTLSNFAVTPGDVYSFKVGGPGSGGVGVNSDSGNGGGGGGSTGLYFNSKAIVIAGGAQGGDGSGLRGANGVDGRGGCDVVNDSGTGNPNNGNGARGGAGGAGGNGGGGLNGSWGGVNTNGGGGGGADGGTVYFAGRTMWTGSTKGSNSGGIGSCTAAGGYSGSSGQGAAGRGSGSIGGKGGNGWVKFTYTTPTLGAQSISCGTATPTFGDAAIAYPAASVAIYPISTTPANASAGALSYGSASGACSDAGGKLQLNSPGTCTYRASAASTNDLSAASQSCSFNIARKPQLLVWSPVLSGPLTVGIPVQITAQTTGAATTNAVTYASTSTSICTVSSSGTVMPNAVGTCSFTANIAGDSTYQDGSLPGSVTVEKGTPVLTWTQAATALLGATGTAKATSSVSSSALNTAVTYTSLTTSVCTISGSQYTAISVGTCTLQADQQGNNNYLAAAAKQMSFQVTLPTPVLTWNDDRFNMVALNGTTTRTVTSSIPGGAITYTSDTPTNCSIDATTGLVKGLKLGKCTLSAHQAATAQAGAVDSNSTLTINVVSFSVTLSWDTSPTLFVGDTTKAQTATSDVPVSAGGSPVVYSTTTPTVCSINSSTGVINALAFGDCIIEANQAATVIAGTTYSLKASLTAANGTSKKITITKGVPTLTWDASPTLFVGDTTKAQTATSTATSALGGGAITYASTSTSICTINASTGVINAIAAGNCVLTASQAGNTKYNAASLTGANSKTIPINRQDATLTWNASPTLTVGDTAKSQTASSTATQGGGAITYSSTTLSVCTINSTSGVINALAVGDCIVTASQAASTKYNAASLTGANSKTLPVGKATPVLSWNTTPTLVIGDTTKSQTASSTATSALGGGAITYASDTPSVCAINAGSGVIKVLTAGDCVLSATQAASAKYNSVSLTGTAAKTITIAKAAATLTWNTSPMLAVGDTGKVQTASSTATAALGGGAITYASTSPAVCSIDANSGLIQVISKGNCVLTASQAASTNYSAASLTGASSKSITVSNTAAALTWNASPSLAIGDTTKAQTASSTATAASGGAPITYASTSPTVCTIDANTGVIKVLTAGDCVLTASQAASANFDAANLSGANSKILTVGKTTPTLTWDTSPSLALGDTTKVQTASSTATRALGGGGITYASTSQSVCTIDANTGVITVLTSGDCVLTASQAASTNYNAVDLKGSNSKILSVGKTTPTLTWDTSPSLIFGDTGKAQTAKSTATTALGGAAVTYASTSPAICSIDANTGVIDVLGAGDCVLTASQTSSTNFNAVDLNGSNSKMITVGKATPTLTWDTSPSLALGDTGKIQTANSTATAALGGGAITYASTTQSICTIDPTTGAIAVLSAGNCVLTASQADSANYNAVSLSGTNSITITIGKITPSLSWDASPSLALGDNSKAQTATSTATRALGGGAITYASTSPLICSIDSNTGVITVLSAGDCVLTATQADSTNFNAVSLNGANSLTLTIGKAAAVLTWDASPSLSVGDTTKAQTATSSATAALGGGAITYASTSLSVCTIDANSGVIKVLTAGDCVLTASQVASTNYNAASLNGASSKTITVGKTTPTLTWGATPSLVIGDTTKAQTATSSATTAMGASAIAYASSNAAVCTIDANTGVIKVISKGDCVLTAVQAASTSYNEARLDGANAKTIKIGQLSQTLTFNAQTTASRKYVPGATFSIAPAATSDAPDASRPITYSSLNTKVCDVSGTTVTMRGAGVCTIAANQAGDSQYSAATQVTQDVQLKALNVFVGTTIPSKGYIAGTATASFTGGGSGCRFDESNTAFVAAASTAPAGQVLPQGMLNFQLVDCDKGATVHVTIEWPQTIEGVRKWGKASNTATAASFFTPTNAQASGKITSFDVTDGALGDEDGQANGTIVDPVAATVAAGGTPPTNPAGVTPVPTLSQWGLLILSFIAALMGGFAVRRRAVRIG